MENLKSFKKQMERELTVFFNEEKKLVEKIDPFSKAMISAIKEFTLRGTSKRIRGYLVQLGYQMHYGKKTREILKAAAAIELIQSSLLIHDDIIDQDDFRRGGPSIHFFFQNYHKKKFKNGMARHFGESTAIVIGDVAYTLAHKVLSKANFPEKRKLKAIHKLNEIMADTCYGECLDVLLPNKSRFTLEDVIKIYKYKSAKYTVEGPLELGAILAGAKEKDLSPIRKFAIPLGIAFQIQDDTLGIFGNAKEMGKPIATDIKQGKRTILIWHALSHSTKKDRAFLNRVLGDKKLKRSDFKRVRKIIKESGSLDFSRSYALGLIRKAKRVLPGYAGVNPRSIRAIKNLADYLIERKK